MRSEKSHAGPDNQEVAYLFASRMLEAKRNKKPAELREALAQKDQAYLTAKRDNFSFTDRALLLFKAKSNYLSGLTKEERIQMQRDAGYTEDEINKITGKKLLFAAGLAQGLGFVSLAARGTSTVNEKILPFIEHIPEQYTSPAIIGSMLLYTASYALFTEKNLQLTKRYGTSANPTVTGMYFLSDKLFPNRIRDNLSRGIPIAQESTVYNVIYPLAVEGVSGEPHKIIAGSIAATTLNLLFTAGCEVWERTRSSRHSRERGNPEVK